ncbi:MAG: YggS family pyridoxal phosphate-dependent enzyme [Candidatus Humimicrobiaceae bacterium]|nr:YggS family pyridoxal phosphate-dependent enzyme [Candidatus Humimicrobiaceae bacterium]
MIKEEKLIEEKKAERLKKNIDNLREEVKKTCNKAGRNVSDVKIVIATKYASLQQVKLLYTLGINNFGENRADELVEKYNATGGAPVWHFIGHLQSRKAKIVVPLVEYIHSIDKISTLDKVNAEAEELNKIQKVLIEVNISGEESKFGIDPEDLYNFLKEALNFKNVNVVGLMTMAPLTDDFKLIRGIFRKLRILMENSNRYLEDINLTELSMGMSNDYRVAIEEGATMIRVGSVIFN